MRILIFAIGLLFLGCGSESKSNPESFTNEISDVIATFSNTVSADGEWDEGAEEETKPKIDLISVENDKFFYCYDTQSLVKIEVYGSIYSATIEFVQGEEKSVILKDKDIDGMFTILPKMLNGQFGTLIIKSQDKILKEIVIEVEGCL